MQQSHLSMATIPNRYAFIDKVASCGAQHQQLSLMLIDVVRFSDVTTSFGIEVGDQFLLEIANRLQQLFKHDMEFGRISGDVFGVVLPGVHSQVLLQQQFEYIVEHFKSPLYYDGHAFIADFNVGVVSLSTGQFDLTLFVSRAEAALKQAKESKYQNYSQLTMHDCAATGRSLALKADLRRALVRDELELYYQPKVDLHSLKVIGAECLLRWNHPTDGLLFPGALIEAAESYNMMNELGYWTLESAFRALVGFDMEGLNLALSVNISPTQLYDTQLVANLQLLSHQYNIELSRIELELTEDVALSNSLMVKKQLAELHAMGLKISVDDFGKGYSNLAYIRDLTIDALKIDKTFVMELTDNPVNRAIIEAARLIGTAKHCEVIAEGIETIEQLHILREIGIATGQGFLFSKAIPYRQFIQLAQSDIIVGGSPARQKIA
ncbi:putative bifunctional diguanylate cyclase/phosphodiesterase [Alteromonas gilva]|uniref:Bifunctional diguanylate cyclase/phosphodiesterase n=1 Tax=Alteromonas gilva TaxID=2987522 RepID=A0ABT5L373_9ALTE|nr:bifunctional diguanylate cyclase/phosphodiesterase [Alteromonas gilva]MDC8831498.1 bifunctional diguanylate cyclase/phosphodiesterase [Alteromonas gilva]